MYTYSIPSNSTYSPPLSSMASKPPMESYDFNYSYYSPPGHEKSKPRYFRSYTRRALPTTEKLHWTSPPPPPYPSTYISPKYEYVKTDTGKRHTRQSSTSSEIAYKFSTASKDKNNEPYYRYTYASHVPRHQEGAKETISPKEAFLDYCKVEDDAKMSSFPQFSNQERTNKSTATLENETIDTSSTGICHSLNHAPPRSGARKLMDYKKNTTSAGYVPAGYSTKNWDPSDEPILLLGSVFDANSLGKWIYDWTVFQHGRASKASDTAGELWLLLIQLAGKVKDSKNISVQERTSSKLGHSSTISGGLHAFTRQVLHSGVLKLLSWAILTRMVSSLSVPADSGDGSNGSPGDPRGFGFPSILSWLSPLIGFVFAAGVTASSKPHSTSRIPGAMALVCNYVSLVASADASTPPAVIWTLKSLAMYFLAFYGDVAFRKYQMGQGYLTILIILGLIIDYTIVQLLHSGANDEIVLVNELLRFSLPAFGLSLFLCAYHAHCIQIMSSQETSPYCRGRARQQLHDEEQPQQPTADYEAHDHSQASHSS